MIGDKIIITKNDIKRAKLVINDILNLKDKSVITIGGGSGTKKTELANCIADLLLENNKHSLILSLDDYYKTHFLDRHRIRILKGLKIVGPQEIDWSLIKKIIKKFKNKNTNKLELQQVNKYTGGYDTVYSYNIKCVNYLIIEGLYSLYLNFLKIADYGIFLEGTPEQTLKFRKKRKKENENDNYRKLIVEKEYKEANKYKKFANVILKIERS